MDSIFSKYQNIAESLDKFFKKEVPKFDDFLKNTRCTSELSRLYLVIQKEILLNKKTLNNPELLKQKDMDITNNILNNEDFQKATSILFDFIENKIDFSDLINKSMILDIDYAINKSKSENKLLDFVNLVDKIEFDANNGGMEYSFVKLFIEDIKNSFDNNSNQNFINDVNAKYISENIDLNIEEIDCLCDVRDFSKKFNKEKKSFKELLENVDNKKIEEEIINLHKSKKEFGIYNEISFTINNKPYLYKFDLATKSWNRDKLLINRVLKKMEELVLEDIVKKNSVDELKAFIIINEKRESIGQKYISNEDFQKFKDHTANTEIIALLDNPNMVIEKDAPKKRKNKLD